MRKKCIAILLPCSLLSILTVPVIACECVGDPPGDCYRCEDGVWVEYGNCEDDGDCEACYDCNDCWCTYICGPAQSCCENGCCDNACCGTEGCCGATKYCCGDPSWNELCCDASEVCCWELIMPGLVIEYYCNPPCSDEITDTTSCSEDNEDDYKCTGCKQISPPTCSPSTYRDYTGLVIETCYDGCPQSDWDVSDEICYQEKNCFAALKSKHLCLECEGEKLCVPIVQFGDPPECETKGECVVSFACEIIQDCWQCTSGDTVVEEVTEETCECD